MSRTDRLSLSYCHTERATPPDRVGQVAGLGDHKVIGARGHGGEAEVLRHLSAAGSLDDGGLVLLFATLHQLNGSGVVRVVALDLAGYRHARARFGCGEGEGVIDLRLAAVGLAASLGLLPVDPEGSCFLGRLGKLVPFLRVNECGHPVGAAVASRHSARVQLFESAPR